MGPRRRALFYGLGHLGVSILAFGLASEMLPTYVPVAEDEATWLIPAAALGLPALSLALLLPRATDAVNDPLIGLWSDRTESRWGRRHPFMAWALVPLLLTFLLLFTPPRPDAAAANLWWWMGAQVLYYLAFTAYVAPYLALLPELAETAQERTSLAAVQGAANLAGLLLGPAVALLAGRMGWPVAPALAVAAAPTLVLPLLVEPPRGEPPKRQPGLRESLALTLTNRPFLMYVGSKFLFLTAMLALVQLLPYMEGEGRPLAEGEAHAWQLAAIVAAILSMPLYVRLRRLRGGRFAYLVSLVVFAVPAAFLTMVGSGLAFGVAIVLCGIGVGGLFSIPYALLADITDLDRVRTGAARQGIYFGVQGLLLKGCYAIGPLVVVSVQRAWPESGVTPVGPVLAAMSLLAAVVFRAYPEEEIEAEIRPAA